MQIYFNPYLIYIFLGITSIFLTLWLLIGGRGGSLDPSRYVFVAFSGFLNFCRQWHLYKFLILGDLSIHLFGLAFPSPTSKKMRVGVHQPFLPPFPSVALRRNILKLCFLKNSYKMLLRLFFCICLSLHIHRYPLGNLALYF